MRKKELYAEPTEASRRHIGNALLQPAADVARDLHDGVCMAIESIRLLKEAILAGPSPEGAMECAVAVESERRSADS